MENFIKENKIIIAIVIGCVILGGFFYATQLSKQNSIEKQQQIEIQSKIQESKDQEKAAELQRARESLGKSSCVSEAERIAVEMNQESCKRGDYCLQGENMYLVTQYKNLYDVCLQRKGLK